MKALKQKTVDGVIWSAVDGFVGQGIMFVVGIVLARLLSPREFGLIGMITIFIAISQSFINSGFASALIRKSNCTETDYSTVFYFNLAAGIVFFILLFLSAPFISIFFKEPELKDIVRVLGIVLIIDSLSIIQRTTLIKRIDFKLQARISVISSLVSGIIAILLAVKGFGVWSLVALQLIKQGLTSLLLWLWNHWRPLPVFNKSSFKELFRFGGNLLISGLIDTIYNNVYYLIIGKYFSAPALGYYTRADQFKNLPAQQMTSIISRVTYPVLTQMQDNVILLKASYKKMIKSIMFVSFILMLGMAATAEPMIIILIGEKWRQSIIYLQMLSIIGMMYPLHSLNLNILNVMGRSDLFLKLEVVKKILVIPTIIIGILWGIKVMILGMWLNTLIAYYLNSYYSGKLINYPMSEQIADILPSFFLALFMGIIVFVIGESIQTGYIIKFFTQISIGGLLVIIISELFKNEAYLYIKNIAIKKIFAVYHARK